LTDPTSLGLGLIESAGKGNLACIRALLDHGAPPNGADLALGGQVQGQTPLVAAIQAASVEIVRELLDRGADPNLRALAFNQSAGVSPLESAAGFSPEAAKLLLRKGADVNSPTKGGFTALHRAVIRGDADLVHDLIEKGAKVDVKEAVSDMTPLDFAIKDHPDLVPLLTGRKK
jgi:ankyrin repeat protein